MTIAKPTMMQPVQRAFAVLELLGRRRSHTISELQALSGIPRPSIVRMLETLIALGYVRRISRQTGYCVTDKVLKLAGGIRHIDRVADAAIEPMEQFTRKSGWPLTLGTVEKGSVSTLFSTNPISPLSMEAASYGVRFSALESAIGRVYLAFSSNSRRTTALKEISRVKGPEAPEPYWRTMLLAPKRLQAEFADIRQRGYAATRSSRSRRVAGIAVPVLVNGVAVAGLVMRYPKSVMPEEQVVRRYKAELMSIAAAVAAASTYDERSEKTKGRSEGD